MMTPVTLTLCFPVADAAEDGVEFWLLKKLPLKAQHALSPHASTRKSSEVNVEKTIKSKYPDADGSKYKLDLVTSNGIGVFSTDNRFDNKIVIKDSDFVFDDCDDEFIAFKTIGIYQSYGSHKMLPDFFKNYDNFDVIIDHEEIKKLSAFVSDADMFQEFTEAIVLNLRKGAFLVIEY